jgi:cysteine desulfurase/selenocysteine lyase
MNTNEIRAEYPLLSTQHDSRPLVYFDNAATSLTPRCVIESMSGYYADYCANVHRGIHRLSERATAAFEGARETARSFINAASSNEIVFTTGATHGLNLITLGWARHHLKDGDRVVLSEMEHHANLVPWHLLKQFVDIDIRAIPVSAEGVLQIDQLEDILNARTRVVSFVMTSNALGTVNPTAEMIRRIRARAPQAQIILDAAQAVAHEPIDVRELGCSALVFSGHKIFGPTGSGVLYLNPDFGKEFAPVMGGGDMIREVTISTSTYTELPSLLEPGTPHIAGAIGLGEALRYVQGLGYQCIKMQEDSLTAHMLQKLQSVPSLRLYGQRNGKIPVFSFSLGDAHPHDVAAILDQYNVAVRSGHHCAQPLMNALGVPATVRASLSFYNTHEEIDLFVDALLKAQELLS